MVAVLTLVAFAIRVSGIGQSLYGDELLTLDDIGGGLSGLGDGLDRNEINPPLFFLAALASAQLGDDTVLIRLPSILLGTATVPVVYALGRQVVGPVAGVVAAALVALSPFAAFYSVEARPYATMTFFVALSTLALLRAVEDERRRWWVLYALAAACAVYSHYTAIFVVAGQAVWAILAHRERLRSLLLAYAAVALAFLPWLPTFLEQRDEDLYTGVIGASVDLTPGTVLEFLMRLFVGHPFRHLPVVPGDAALVLLGLAAAALAVAAALRLRGGGPRVSSPLVLLLVTAAVVPVGLLLYALVADDLYAPRNLSAAIPALAVLVAAALTAFSPRISGALVGVVLVAMVVALSRGLDADQLRPQSKQVAEYLEGRAQPGEPVVRGIGEVNALKAYLHGHPILNESGDDQDAWDRAAAGGSAFLVHGEVGELRILPRFAGPAGRFELVESRQFPGLRKLAVGRYVGPVSAWVKGAPGRQTLVVSPGPDIAIRPGAVNGVQEKVDQQGGRLRVSAWGIAADRSRPADALFVLDGDRVVAIASPTILRPDVAAGFGLRVEPCGFALSAMVDHAERLVGSGRLRTFAAVGSTASELPPLR